MLITTRISKDSLTDGFDVSTYLLRSFERASFLQSTVIVGVGGVSCSAVGSGDRGGSGGLHVLGQILGDPFNPTPL